MTPPSRGTREVVLRTVLTGYVVVEKRPKKWCRMCHSLHALPECGLSKGEAPEPVVIEGRETKDGHA